MLSVTFSLPCGFAKIPRGCDLPISSDEETLASLKRRVAAAAGLASALMPFVKITNHRPLVNLGSDPDSVIRKLDVKLSTYLYKGRL